MSEVVIFRNMGRHKLEKGLARMDAVQAELEYRAFEAGIRAEELLMRHRLQGHAEISVERGRIDRYVILSDERGQDAAMSIEFGRAGYIDPDTGETYGEMEPLHILSQAFYIRRLPGNRVRKVRKRRASRKVGLRTEEG